MVLLLAVTQSELALAEQESTDWQVSGFLAVEGRSFFHQGLAQEQDNYSGSVVFEPEFATHWGKDNNWFVFTPFLRLDSQDDERTHFDIRELSWIYVSDSWELRAGIRKVFWGVTESQHLVDIINQTDLVENIDGEDKLGQPMVNLALIQDWGTVDLFILPGFRERTFPGVDGRLRFNPRVEPDRAVFESSAEEHHIDFALRWSGFFGNWDVGISHFHGTSRDPRFGVDASDPQDIVLFPIYDQIDQTGLDLQYTIGSWLWKLEAIYRSGQDSSFVAAAGGFEYTLYGLFDSPWNLGVLVEYLYDDRSENVRSPFEEDVFFGFRLALNDAHSSEALLGCIQDLDESTRFCSVEASRRFGGNWLLSLEARIFDQVSSDDPLFSLRNDDLLQVELAYHF